MDIDYQGEIHWLCEEWLGASKELEVLVLPSQHRTIAGYWMILLPPDKYRQPVIEGE